MDKQSNDEPLQVADVAYVSVPQAEASALPINDGARAYLNAHHWPPGLQDTFLANLAVLSIRYFICDDSGSMVSSDGNRRVGDGTYSKCTRWLELTETLTFHAGLARAANAPTEFRLLNGDAPVRLGFGEPDEQEHYDKLIASFHRSPVGGTPLCRRIAEVVAEIRLMEPQLRASGQKACVVIATDGESSDGDIITAMQPLRDLPTWVVVRLCTDEPRIVHYWNTIDSQLELDMDVLDDLKGEAEEVSGNNSWLTYGEPLHRLREFGVLIKELDMMDSSKLTLDQIRKLCAHVYGGAEENFPNPAQDLRGFLAAVHRENRRVGRVFDPVKGRMRNWVSRRQLRRMQQDGGCVMC